MEIVYELFVRNLNLKYFLNEVFLRINPRTIILAINYFFE